MICSCCLTCFYEHYRRHSSFSCCCCFFLSHAYKPCAFTALFNFGDSNSDTGGRSAAFVEVLPPNGETFFGKPAGRLGDGRLVIDFIASSLNFPYSSAYLDSLASNFSTGANFATGGSTIRRPNTTAYSPISLDVQSGQFSQFKSRSSLIYKQSENYFSDALYTFDIGRNDFTSGYNYNMSTEEVKATIPAIIQNFKEAIQSVYGEGGRNFWIHNMGPFGCLPFVFERNPAIKSEVDKHGCGVAGNEVVELYNEKLKDVINELRTEFALASFVYVDIYSLKYSLFTEESQKYGFEDPLISCCGSGGKYNVEYSCGETRIVNGTSQLIGGSCRNPLNKVTWDGLHYTEAANKFVFDRISTGDFSDPPLSINMTCHA